MALSGTSEFAELKLDPGPRARRKAKITVTCLLTTLLVLASFSILLWLLGNIGVQISSQRAPHIELYQDLKVPYKPSEVIRTLLERNQTFSVVATVWIREDNSEDVESTEESTHLAEMVEGGPILTERVLFSETVFHDLRVEDNLKDIKTVAKLRIPTAVFKRQKLWSYDLRASFVLIPNSPSPLDHAVNYSSWIPEGVNYPAIRPSSAEHEPSLKDVIVDSYGTFIPLLAFKPINSSCPKSQNVPETPNHLAAEEYDKGFADDNDENNDNEMNDIPVSSSVDPAVDNEVSNDFFGKGYTSTKQKAPFEAHPYIITRSHLRVVDMSKLYNRKSYEKHHRELRSNACGQMLVDGKKDWRLCWKRFEVNGNSETRIKLRKMDAKSQKTSIKWAYAPFLSLSSTAWGPLDLVKVPVNRENCGGSESSVITSESIGKASEMDYLNVTWNIAFSARTPEKLFLADTAGLIFSAADASGHSEDERRKAHEKFELVSGVTGHRLNEDTHPRIYFLLFLVHKAMSFILAILNFHYWYTRASTIGISTRGNLYIACAVLLDISVNVLFKSSKAPRTVLSWLFSLLWCIPSALTPLFILKAVLRAEVKWIRWIPLLTFARATHGERASERVEARVPLRYTIVAFAALSALAAYTVSVLPPSTPSQGLIHIISTRVQPLIVFPAITVGCALQLILNLRLKSFASTYRPAALLSLVLSVLSAAMGSPYIVGQLTSLEGLSVLILAKLGWSTLLVYQAARYPLVLGQEEEEDSVR